MFAQTSECLTGMVSQRLVVCRTMLPTSILVLRERKCVEGFRD